MASGVVWYVGYGSNMHAERFACYLAGGTPAGATRGYPGCRDTRPPLATRALEVPGGIYFATESPVWLGGRAFYDPALPGVAAARGYLVTAAQFADVAAQEMYREPGPDLDLTVVTADGRHVLGPGRYETLLHLGEHDGHPALTFTAPWGAADVEHTKPSADYLTVLATGLAETHGWRTGRIADYLAGRTPFWSAADVAALVDPARR
ncbi:histone deacetylase [Saccharothrix sp. 6-C]|uniref:histone deacetylase n=1 Tax=Saccharothrix sp. 6-C TaxID=2781735 RepID=UPI001F2D1E75|nr:histone deacetylase [Saccharothrix sp. 6-C]